jgi:hypothetical protein
MINIFSAVAFAILFGGGFMAMMFFGLSWGFVFEYESFKNIEYSLLLEKVYRAAIVGAVIGFIAPALANK